MTFSTGLGFTLKVKPKFDSATPEQAKQVVDSLIDRETQSLVEQARSDGLSIVLGLANVISNNELEDGELNTDVLDGLIVEATDGEEDGESTYYDLLSGAISDAFESLGVDETVVNDIFSDDIDVADTAIAAAVDTIIANLPDDGDAIENFSRDFIYGESESESFGDYDAAVRGGRTVRKVNGRNVAYRGTLAVRKGKKVVVNKRIGSQAVRLSAGQRGALKKARLKAFTSNAIRSRVRSVRKGHTLGIYK